MSFDWKEVWERKGASESNDLASLNGYNGANEVLMQRAPKDIAAAITKIMNLNESDRVLEVGCGAGCLAQFLKCNYVGADYSKSLVRKHIEVLGNSVLQCEAANLPFKDKFFDKAFAFSVFQYFPNQEYAKQAISEMKRVSKELVLVGDLPRRSHSKDHTTYPPEFPAEGSISPAFGHPDRVNVLISLAPKNGNS